MEPVNTCMKGIEAPPSGAGRDGSGDRSGPDRAHFEVLARRTGARVITSDLYPQRLTISERFGFDLTIDASRADVVRTVREMTEGRGADAVILAVGGTA